jgi:hypothetical protein
MRVPSCHRQTLLPRQISELFEWSTLHSQTIRKRLANVCRNWCERKFLIFASTTAPSNQCRPFSSGSPVFADWSTRPLPSPRPCATIRAAIAASFSGTCIGSSFFVRGTFNILPFQSTISQVSESFPRDQASDHVCHRGRRAFGLVRCG